jgi:hypothetical protein
LKNHRAVLRLILPDSGCATDLTIFASSRRIFQRFHTEPMALPRSWYDGGHSAFSKGGIMPGTKYYLRQADAFLSLAQSTTDAPLQARYRMMAERFRGMACEPAADPDGAPDRRSVTKEPPMNFE